MTAARKNQARRKAVAMFGNHIRIARRRGAAADGFTLMEAMIASLVMAFVLTSVLAIAAQSARYMSDIRRTARSSQVLQQRMEDLRLLSWSQLAALPTTFVDSASPAGTFSGTVYQTTYDTYNGTATVKRVTLAVTWKNQAGRPVTNALTSLIGNGGINTYIF